ncbi:MAG: ATP-binding cassette domain-containing protein, partial [Candidatus Omnitrophica bacterium]|nr:ATP-binding cassette domain-containing protein [Candidatus Omnitrophota bacterium]
HVNIGGKEVVGGLNLKLSRGDVMVLLGQNGSGKTSLIMAIMGFPSYEVTKGDILFKGASLLGMSIDKRAQLGIGILFQRPPTVRGVKLRQVLESAASRNKGFDLGKTADALSMTDFLDRDMNFGFSGGEMKRSELLQVIAQDPELVLFDEPESGVDLENVGLMSKIIGNFLGTGGRTGLIITHTGYILDYIKADTGCVLSDGLLHCVKDPKKIIQDIRKYGYGKCLTCKG